jgi:hypothetical protein
MGGPIAPPDPGSFAYDLQTALSHRSMAIKQKAQFTMR